MVSTVLTYNLNVEKLTKLKFEHGSIEYWCLGKNKGMHLLLIIWDNRYGINLKWVAEFLNENRKLILILSKSNPKDAQTETTSKLGL